MEQQPQQAPEQQAPEQQASEHRPEREAGRGPDALRRAMVLGDVDQVLLIETSAYRFPWSRGNFIDSLAAGYLADVLDGGPTTGLQGYFIAMPGVDELHLLNVTVAPVWQGRGLGTALLDAVAQLAHARGLSALWLEVREGNGRARALYRRRGFVEVGLRRGYYPGVQQREDAIVMRRAIAVPTAEEAAEAGRGVD